jgi:hypothetical protein
MIFVGEIETLELNFSSIAPLPLLAHVAFVKGLRKLLSD